MGKFAGRKGSRKKEKKEVKIKTFKTMTKKINTGGMYVVNNSKILSNLNSSSLRESLYDRKHKILIVGDGDLSFGMSLCSSIGGGRIYCTVYDTEGDFHKKYIEALPNLDLIKKYNGKLRFHVDAKSLDSNEWIKEQLEKIENFDRIVFNFPHVGTDNLKSVEDNKELLRLFFRSGSKILEKKKRRNACNLEKYIIL